MALANHPNAVKNCFWCARTVLMTFDKRTEADMNQGYPFLAVLHPRSILRIAHFTNACCRIQW